MRANCEKKPLKMWSSKYHALEEARSSPRRSPRLASQNGIKSCEIQPGIPDFNPRRISMRLRSASHLSTKFVKERIANPRFIDEGDFKKPSKSKAVASRFSMRRRAAMVMSGKEVEAVKRIDSGIENDTEIVKITPIQNKRRKIKEDEVKNIIEETENKECNGLVTWNIEQEEALQKAFLMTKPSPHFWKKVSRLVPRKSAQECFDKIHTAIATPQPNQPKPRTKRKYVSPIAGFDQAANISHLFEKEAGKQKRCRMSRLAAHKTVRHLLRKNRLTDRQKASDQFYLLESSAGISVNAGSSETSQSPGTNMPDNTKMLSRLKLLALPDGSSPQVLKAVKNRSLHDRYIDQLHHREARRNVLAKRSNFYNSGRIERGSLKAARSALISDARSFINHFQSAMANCRHELEDDDSDDDDEGINVI